MTVGEIEIVIQRVMVHIKQTPLRTPWYVCNMRNLMLNCSFGSIIEVISKQASPFFSHDQFIVFDKTDSPGMFKCHVKLFKSKLGRGVFIFFIVTYFRLFT